MLVLIFPKPFEFFKFISYCLSSESQCIVSSLIQTSDYGYDLYFHLNDRSSRFKLPILLIGDSDINFYSIFSRLVGDNCTYRYLLIGSCGSANEEDFGKMFRVEKAIKGDRGILQRNHTFLRKDQKIPPSEMKDDRIWKSDHTYFKDKLLGSKSICSTNFMNEDIISKEYENYLFDMETYDFYDICFKNQVKWYTCIRFVTDFVQPIDETPSQIYEHLLLCQRLLSMKGPQITPEQLNTRNKLIEDQYSADFFWIKKSTNFYEKIICSQNSTFSKIKESYGPIYHKSLETLDNSASQSEEYSGVIFDDEYFYSVSEVQDNPDNEVQDNNNNEVQEVTFNQIIHDQEVTFNQIIHDQEVDYNQNIQDQEVTFNQIIHDQEVAFNQIIQEVDYNQIIQDQEVTFNQIIHDQEVTSNQTIDDQDNATAIFIANLQETTKNFIVKIQNMTENNINNIQQATLNKTNQESKTAVEDDFQSYAAIRNKIIQEYNVAYYTILKKQQGVYYQILRNHEASCYRIMRDQTTDDESRRKAIEAIIVADISNSHIKQQSSSFLEITQQNIDAHILFFHTQLKTQKLIQDLKTKPFSELNIQDLLTIFPPSPEISASDYISKFSDKLKLRGVQQTSLPMSLNLSETKKVIRLKSHFNFEFVFEMDLESNELQWTELSRNCNIRDVYESFKDEYINKIKKLDDQFTLTSDKLAENNHKVEIYNAKKAQKEVLNSFKAIQRILFK